jgi:hypothetical protein
MTTAWIGIDIGVKEEERGCGGRGDPKEKVQQVTRTEAAHGIQGAKAHGQRKALLI